MQDAASVKDAVATLAPEDFLLDSHQRIYRAMRDMLANNQSVDLVTVMDTLGKRKELDAVGGPAYLAMLTEGIPAKPNVDSYVKIVKAKSVGRRLSNVFNDGMVAAADEESAETIIPAIAEQMQNLLAEGVTQELEHVSKVFFAYGSIDEMYERMATVQGIHTGITEFDKMTMGYQPKALSILAARPSMGKTARMICDAYHSAVVLKRPTAIFTLEQDKNDFIRRMLSNVASVPYRDIQGGTLTREQRHGMQDAQSRIMDAPLYITDSTRMTCTRIRAMCSSMKRRGGLDIAFIDQLSKLKSTDVYRKGMPKHEIIGEQTDSLKQTAQEIDIAVVLLCQLRRHDGKGDARPHMDSLKDSGDIEEDADMVQFLHRPIYFDRKSQEPDEIIIAKQREGDTGTCQVKFNGAYMRWGEVEGTPVQGEFGNAY